MQESSTNSFHKGVICIMKIVESLDQFDKQNGKYFEEIFLKLQEAESCFVDAITGLHVSCKTEWSTVKIRV